MIQVFNPVAGQIKVKDFRSAILIQLLNVTGTRLGYFYTCARKLQCEEIKENMNIIIFIEISLNVVALEMYNFSFVPHCVSH